MANFLARQTVISGWPVTVKSQRLHFISVGFVPSPSPLFAKYWLDPGLDSSMNKNYCSIHKELNYY